MTKSKIIQSGNDTFEFDVDRKNSIIIQRHFTKHDIEIHSLPIPKRPVWLFITVKSLQFYQKYISEKLGNRCIFDPSYSRYSEIAFRKYGFSKGVKLTISRLRRCKPQNGDQIEFEDQPQYHNLITSPTGDFILADYYNINLINTTLNETVNIASPIEMDMIKFKKWNDRKLEFTCDEFTNWDRHLVMEFDADKLTIEIKDEQK